MQTKTLLLVAAAAASASAQGLAGLHPGHVAAKRDLVARATPTGGSGGGDTTCATALLSVYSSLPTLPADLMSYEQSNLPTGARLQLHLPRLAVGRVLRLREHLHELVHRPRLPAVQRAQPVPPVRVPHFPVRRRVLVHRHRRQCREPHRLRRGPGLHRLGSGSSSGSSSGSGTGSNGGVTVSAGSREAGFVAAAAVAVAGILGAIVAL